jgi:hypothetical protein
MQVPFDFALGRFSILLKSAALWMTPVFGGCEGGATAGPSTPFAALRSLGMTDVFL